MEPAVWCLITGDMSLMPLSTRPEWQVLRLAEEHPEVIVFYADLMSPDAFL